MFWAVRNALAFQCSNEVRDIYSLFCSRLEILYFALPFLRLFLANNGHEWDASVQSIRNFICDRVMALPTSSSWIENFFENRVSAFNNFIAKMKISGEFTDNYGLISLATSLILGNK